jgi:5-methyltetrahydropteroyltriglutamate--homocysteine methyltransferase
MITTILGFPRIGRNRRLKWALESYWRGTLSESELLETAASVRQERWRAQQAAGIDVIPSNDFSLYDQMLDTACLVGNVPPRFQVPAGQPVRTDTMFLMARGARPVPRDEAAAVRGPDVSPFAMEMTKWFDTNYHYIVPELRADTGFALTGSKPFDEFREALALGIRTRPVLVGPVTYLLLGKPDALEDPSFDRLALLDALLPVYGQVLQRLAAEGAEWVQLDEPALALDLTPAQRSLMQQAYVSLRAAAPGLKLLVTSYFGELRENLDTFLSLPVDGLHVDAVRGGAELEEVLRRFPEDRWLSLGLIDGRNVWRADLQRALALVGRALFKVGEGRLMLATSCSLQHVPLGLEEERRLDPEIRSWLAFAEEKLGEIVTLASAAKGDARAQASVVANGAILRQRSASPRLCDPQVRAAAAAVTPAQLARRSPFPERQRQQRAALKLPPFPTTTIGSFPQTDELRAIRSSWKRGELGDAAYAEYIEREIRRAVTFQEEVGLDVLVHGEPERNDMVEFFGEQLGGFAFTDHGWVQSYGSRCVKPPIIYGDVTRPTPMTVRWSQFAQSLTARPLKGMLTGPVTMLQWSFVRDDLPRSEVCRQLALALRQEVRDLEAAKIRIIQIDEPALREGLPLRRGDWQAYLRWAVDGFRLAAAGVDDRTQIHSHMCYAEFNDIIGDIAALDADVITIEASRSNMKLLEAFASFNYPNEIGPGLYDIHSPRVPFTDEMVALLGKAAAVLPPENLWVNPDCGLKTRRWKEVEESLRNMVAAAAAWRARRSGVREAFATT